MSKHVCHEAVTRKGYEEPCDKPAVAERWDERPEFPGWYPVCPRHTRGKCRPLLLAELDQAKAEIERLMRPRPDDKHPIEIRHGWLVESGYEPNFVPGYGYEPDTDAAPLMKLSDLPGWPGAELDAALAVIQQVRELVDEWSEHHHDEPVYEMWKPLARIVGGAS